MPNNQSVGSTSHLISLNDAAAMTTLYRDEKAKVLVSTVDEDILPLCETFSRGDFDTLLAQTGCEGVRIYYGMKTNLDICAILVGVNEDNEDMVSSQTLSNIIIENGDRCPVLCPPTSDLNS